MSEVACAVLPYTMSRFHIQCYDPSVFLEQSEFEPDKEEPEIGRYGRG